MATRRDREILRQALGDTQDDRMKYRHATRSGSVGVDHAVFAAGEEDVGLLSDLVDDLVSDFESDLVSDFDSELDSDFVSDFSDLSDLPLLSVDDREPWSFL
jgi:hypothetical protein